jgi:hypothetical protein
MIKIEAGKKYKLRDDLFYAEVHYVLPESDNAYSPIAGVIRYTSGEFYCHNTWRGHGKDSNRKGSTYDIVGELP